MSSLYFLRVLSKGKIKFSGGYKGTICQYLIQQSHLTCATGEINLYCAFRLCIVFFFLVFHALHPNLYNLKGSYSLCSF